MPQITQACEPKLIECAKSTVMQRTSIHGLYEATEKLALHLEFWESKLKDECYFYCALEKGSLNLLSATCVLLNLVGLLLRVCFQLEND